MGSIKRSWELHLGSIKDWDIDENKKQHNTINLREYYLINKPSLFYHEPETCADVPNTHLLESLVSSPVRVIDNSLGYDFEYFSINYGLGILEHLVNQNQLNTIERRRVLYAKLQYIENHPTPIIKCEDKECYHKLPSSVKNKIIFSNNMQRRFAADFIFGSKKQFQCVCNKYSGNPFEIAAIYRVPLFYILYQFAYYKMYQSFFVSSINGKIYRYEGHEKIPNTNKAGKIIYLYPIEKIIPNLLVAKKENTTPLYYWEIELGSNQFLCMGKGINKRNRWRVHFFGEHRKYISTNTLEYLKDVGVKIM